MMTPYFFNIIYHLYYCGKCIAVRRFFFSLLIESFTECGCGGRCGAASLVCLHHAVRLAGASQAVMIQEGANLATHRLLNASLEVFAHY